VYSTHVHARIPNRHPPEEKRACRTSQRTSRGECSVCGKLNGNWRGCPCRCRCWCRFHGIPALLSPAFSSIAYSVSEATCHERRLTGKGFQTRLRQSCSAVCYKDAPVLLKFTQKVSSRQSIDTCLWTTSFTTNTCVCR